LPDVVAGAAQPGIQIAAHIEPYNGRSVASVLADAAYLRSLGVRTIYVYQAFAGTDPADWAAANDAIHALGVTTFAQTVLVGQAAVGHFSGVYTYDTVTYGAPMLPRFCNEAHTVHLLCAPSVGPGYDARRAIGDPQIKPRRHGLTYDSMWHTALAAGADRITITSFNEWQEGTQIEPAVPLRLGEYSYGSYDGAWGLHGAAAENAYLARTAYWANLFRRTSARPKPLGSATVAGLPCHVADRNVSAPLAPLPNALTVARLVVIPIFAALLISADGGHSWAAAILFGAAAITDQIDGYLARRWHVESEFGKISDPLADRVLIDVAVRLAWHAGRRPWLPPVTPPPAHPPLAAAPLPAPPALPRAAHPLRQHAA